MDEWIKFGQTFGVPTLIIAALFVFIYLFVWRLLWPFIISRQEKSEKAKEQERLDRMAITDKFVQATDKFVESMAPRDKMMKKSLSAQNAALDESTRNVVVSLNIITTEVKKTNGRAKQNDTNK